MNYDQSRLAAETTYRIMQIKEKLGSKLLILGHHYQKEEVIQFADFRGDSFLLARRAAQCADAQYIVFLGVNFMAETADIVTSSKQKVYLPDPGAGCLMADMAPIKQVLSCWREVQKLFPGEVIPVTYVNSSAEVKAFCGENGGLACTSSSAVGAFRWVLGRGKRILFFPDEHLGRNTGLKLGIDPGDMAVWDRFHGSLEGSTQPRLILWNGFCPVHRKFGPERVGEIRKKYPGIKIVVHPECTCETVRAADDNGSTEHIIRRVRESAPGSAWAVGTEINLVQRLASEYRDRKVVSLDPGVEPCPDMLKITPANLLQCLEGILSGKGEKQVQVDPGIAGGAGKALERMLSIS